MRTYLKHIAVRETAGRVILWRPDADSRYDMVVDVLSPRLAIKLAMQLLRAAFRLQKGE